MSTPNDSPPAPPRTPAWTWWVCILLLLATMLNYMDRSTLNQMALRIKLAMLLSNEQYGELEMAFGLAFAGGALLFGWSADRWNVRWLYAISLLTWSAAGFVTGFAQTFWGLLTCRLFLGLFESGNWPCALRTTQRILPPKQRTLGNSILQSGGALGAILTPLLVQLLLFGSLGSWLGSTGLLPSDHFKPEHVSVLMPSPLDASPGGFPLAGLLLSSRSEVWRYPFFVIGAIGTLWVILWLLTVRQSDLALPAAEPKSLSSATRNVNDSVLAIYCTRRFLVLVTLVISINLTWHFFRVWLPLFLQEQHHYSEQETNYFMSLYYAATDAGSLTAGFGTLYLARRGFSIHGSRVVIFLGCSLLTTLSLTIAFLDKGPLLLGLLLVLGFGALGLFPVYYSFSQELTTRHQGKVTGTLGCCTWLVTSVMHKIVGRWLDQTKDYSTVVAVAGLFPLIAFVVLLTLWRTPKTQASGER